MYTYTEKHVLSENIVIHISWTKVRKTKTYPSGIKFGVVGMVRKQDEFREAIRIDNSHDEITHVHYLDKQKRKGRHPTKELPRIQSHWKAYAKICDYLTKKYPHLL